GRELVRVCEVRVVDDGSYPARSALFLAVCCLTGWNTSAQAQTLEQGVAVPVYNLEVTTRQYLTTSLAMTGHNASGHSAPGWTSDGASVTIVAPSASHIAELTRGALDSMRGLRPSAVGVGETSQLVADAEGRVA